MLFHRVMIVARGPLAPFVPRIIVPPWEIATGFLLNVEPCVKSVQKFSKVRSVENSVAIVAPVFPFL